MDKAKYPDWSVTVMFYCALHYVDAVLDEKIRIHPRTHGDRSKKMARLSVFTSEMFTDYRLLLTRSELARYDHWRGSGNKRKFTESAVEQLERDTFTPLVKSLKKILT